MQLNYKISSSLPNKPYVILIHGLFGDADNLAGIRRHLESEFNMISVDLPNHGDSPHCQNFSIDLCVNSILEILKQEGIESAIWLGHSLGGKVAMTAALRHPEYCSTLIVVDIAPVDYADNHSHIFAALQQIDLESITSRASADKQLSLSIPEPGIRAFLLKSLVRNDDQWMWKFNLSGLNTDYRQVRGWTQVSNADYDGPTLFIKGSQSDYINATYQATIRELFPKAKAHIIEGAGHWPHAEKPAIFNRVVDKFLRH